jgi:hypothetical protein
MGKRMTVKCPKCQTDNPDTKQFCGDCGTKLTPLEEVSPSITKTLDTSAEELSRGTLLAGRYEIIEELGKERTKVYPFFSNCNDLYTAREIGYWIWVVGKGI